MFDQSYNYKLSHKEKVNDGTLEEVSIYSCRSKNNDRYIIRVEKYSHNLFVPKFHLQSHRYSKDKYKTIINKKYANRILNTCLMVLLEIYAENPSASFLIHGMNSSDETLEKTKRYRIYKLLISSKFSSERFHHTFIDKKSIYVLINKSYDRHEYYNQVESIFRKYFEGNELLE